MSPNSFISSPSNNWQLSWFQVLTSTHCHITSQGPVSDFNWSGQRLSHPLPSLKGQQSDTSGFTTGKLRGNVNSQENRKFICLLNFGNLELVNLFENLEFILPKKAPPSSPYRKIAKNFHLKKGKID